MRPSKIDRYLSADADLQPVVEKARAIAAISKLCERALPPELARQVRAANLKDGTLVLLASNAAAAAKLKLLSESLSRFLSTQGTKVNLVSVRVQPTASRPQPAAAPHKRARFSPSALAELAELHQRLSESRAREALALLLEHQGGSRPPAPRTDRRRKPRTGPAFRRAARK